MAVLMITHDLGVIAETADDVAVMYRRPSRRICADAGTLLFHSPKHPYTRGPAPFDLSGSANGETNIASPPSPAPCPIRWPRSKAAHSIPAARTASPASVTPAKARSLLHSPSINRVARHL